MTIEPSLIVWTVLCFLALMLILKKLLFQPMLTFMDTRNAKIEAARKAKEEEAAERRQRNDELREEAAERARVNNSVLGRMKNTAISSATRTVTNKLTNEILKGLGLGKKK